MAVGRYVVVDVGTLKILAGPFRLDPVANPGWTPPVAGTLMLEAAALSGGYTVAVTPPDPADVLRQKIPAAIAANNAFIANGAPTNAQVVAYLKVVARELNGLGRLAAQLLDDTSDS